MWVFVNCVGYRRGVSFNEICMLCGYNIYKFYFFVDNW